MPQLYILRPSAAAELLAEITLEPFILVNRFIVAGNSHEIMILQMIISRRIAVFV